MLNVMTQNLYVGADLDPVVEAAESGDFEALVIAGAQAWGAVLATDFATRAEAIAAAVDDADPDLLALQEVALWRGQYPADSVTETPTPATDVLQDFLSDLLDALEARGLEYDVLSVLDTTDVELPIYDPGLDDLVDLRHTDRDALLVRRDAVGTRILVDDVASGLFDTRLDLESGISVLDGWITADLTVFGESVRVVTTHLSVTHPLQAGQAAELMAGPLSGSGRLILLGDLNSDALHGPGPDDTPTYDDLLDFGLEDAWSDVHPRDAGETWGRDAALVDPEANLWERIDFVLYRGDLDPKRADRYGADPSEMVGGLWPSDHAGVAAQVMIR